MCVQAAFLELEFGVWLLESCYYGGVPGALCMGFINICLARKKRGDCGVKPLQSNCLLEATRYKCGEGRAVSCWWTVVA